MRSPRCPRRLTMVAVGVAVALTAPACSAGDDPAIDATGTGDHANGIAAKVASYDLVAGRPGWFIVGALGLAALVAGALITETAITRVCPVNALRAIDSAGS